MTAIGREALERDLEAAHSRGEFAGAVKLGLESYGPEVLGLLLAVLRDHDAAGDVYAEFAANLWAAFPKFRWESSFRTWAYTLARNAAFRHLRDPLRKRSVSLDDCPMVDEIADVVRTATATFRRTEAKESVAALRRSLSPEDQMLLVLRVDRSMSWDEIAQVMAPDVVDASGTTASEPAARKRVTATLRKRFERIKAEIRAMLAANPSAAR